MSEAEHLALTPAERTALIEQREQDMLRLAEIIAAPFEVLRRAALAAPMREGGGAGHEREIYAGFASAFGRLQPKSAGKN